MSTLKCSTPELEGEMKSEEQLVEEAGAFASQRSVARLNRRRLITNLGLAAGAASVLGVTGCSDNGPATVVTPVTPSSAPSVTDVMNFALNLEYFEASLYSYLVTGQGLSSANMGSGAGTVTGGAQVTFKYSALQNIAMNLMTEEVQHVEILRAAITAAGGTPVSMPNLNLAPSTALTIKDDATFVSIARTIETVGTSAYEGAAQYLTSVPSVLTIAASIHDVEGQHEGALRQACLFFPGGTALTSPAADALDIPPTMSAIFNTNPSTGLNTARTVQQVLGIVYGVSTSSTTTPPTGVTSGGFFPNGFNGNVKST